MSIGEIVAHDEYFVDLGAVDDSGLATIRDDITFYVAHGGHDFQPGAAEEDLRMVWLEIVDRVRFDLVQHDDLPGAYHCRLGCCE